MCVSFPAAGLDRSRELGISGTQIALCRPHRVTNTPCPPSQDNHLAPRRRHQITVAKVCSVSHKLRPKIHQLKCALTERQQTNFVQLLCVCVALLIEYLCITLVCFPNSLDSIQARLASIAPMCPCSPLPPRQNHNVASRTPW